jgi:DNA repair protein RadC
MQLTFLDHIIIGKPSPGRTPYFSFREAGWVT